MIQTYSASRQTVVQVPVAAPYNFALSLSATRGFRRGAPSSDSALKLPVRIRSVPVVVEARLSRRGEVQAICRPERYAGQARDLVRWVLFAELDLMPFYGLVKGDSKLAHIAGELHGLKPTRPASLFEMAVTAITEQQLSLASANHIRGRLVQRFGEPVEGLWVFPEPDALASASPESLRSCGLSKQKAAYIHWLASQISEGYLNLDALKAMGDDEAREAMMRWPGFGRWSADYMLVRGLARQDCVPVDDLGIRDVIGAYLGDGIRVTPDEATEKLEAFRPYRGLLAFYLLVHKRYRLSVKSEQTA
jgi:DNA-3-methyladenine glycosylase II